MGEVAIAAVPKATHEERIHHLILRKLLQGLWLPELSWQYAQLA